VIVSNWKEPGPSSAGLTPGGYEGFKGVQEHVAELIDGGADRPV
jgi:hypothetical protein